MTIEIGPFQVCRVLEATIFLFGNSKIPRAVLPKSQCWCVDGNSKFVMKARDECCRIELPNKSELEAKRVEEFKQVLPKVLRYEITPCPFKRGFQVDLPEPPKEPIVVRPWKPRQASQPPLTQTFIEPQFMEESPGRWALRRTDTEGSEPRIIRPSTGGTSSSPPSDLAKDLELNQLHGGDASSEGRESSPLAPITEDTSSTAVDACHDYFKTPDRARAPRNNRTVTAPPHLASKNHASSETTGETTATSKPPLPSLTSNLDSFRSFHSPISPLPPSPPYSDPPSPTPVIVEDTVLGVSRSRAHKRDPSEVTITADSAMFEPQLRIDPLLSYDNVATADSAMFEPQLQTEPMLSYDNVNSDAFSENQKQLSTSTLVPSSSPSSPSSPLWPESPTPSPRTQIRQRRISRQRPRSPLPPTRSQTSPSSSSSGSFYSPTSARLCASTGHHLTTAILQKTCSVLLGPPVQLIALMMNMARRIARGAYNGLTFGYAFADSPRKPGERKKVPGGWESSLGSETDGESVDGRSNAQDNKVEPLSRATNDNDDYDDGWDDEDDFGMTISSNGGGSIKARLLARERAEKLRREAAGLAGWGVD